VGGVALVSGLELAGGYALAFGLTWLIETIVYLWVFRSLGWLAAGSRLRVGRAVLVVFGLNLATHPLLWLFTSAVPGIGPLVAAEALVVLVEGTLLALVAPDPDRRERWVWSMLAALLANAVTLLFGLVAYPPLLDALTGPVLRGLGAAGSSACC
jgi:hypothetical protein